MTTALIYGLSPYALELLVRVLVLELIPLTAALFVALRCTIPSGAELARLRFRGEFEAQRALGIDPVRRQLMPRVVAGIVSVLLLAAVSCVVALLLSYLGVYGFTCGGLVGYMRGRWAGARRPAPVSARAICAARRRRRFTTAAPFRWTCGVNRWRRARGTSGGNLARDRDQLPHPRCAPIIASSFAPPFEHSGDNP